MYQVSQCNEVIFVSESELIAYEYARLTSNISGVKCVVKKVKK